jgi:hypothetical protein
MTINARMLITVLLFSVLTPLWAQNQRLAWDGEEYAMRYEVIIEKEEEGEYNGVLREFTEESFIEVSLLPGKYRCQIIPYDFFNQPVPVTDWVDFEVRSSFHEIITVSEIPSAAPETEKADAESTEPEPEKITESKNLFDLYLGAAWVWLVPIYYEGGKERENFDESKFFGRNAVISPYGAAVRFGIVSTKRRFFKPGMELTALWRIYTTGSGENAQSLLFDSDMIQQFHFIDGRIALNLRLGAGVSLVSSDDLMWSAGQQYSTHVNFGASLRCLILKNLFLETGMEYSQFFMRDFFCFLRSWIGLGYQF